MKYAVAILILLSGCVSVRTHQREVREAYLTGLQKARKAAYYQRCEGAVTEINRLIKREERP